jgi:hypothetical protein
VIHEKNDQMLDDGIKYGTAKAFRISETAGKDSLEMANPIERSKLHATIYSKSSKTCAVRAHNLKSGENILTRRCPTTTKGICSQQHGAFLCGHTFERENLTKGTSLHRVV